jgi:hypothetical protein
MSSHNTPSFWYGIELRDADDDLYVYGFDSNELRAWLDEPVDFDGKTSASVPVPGLDLPVVVTIGSWDNDKLIALTACMPTEDGLLLDPHPWVTPIADHQSRDLLAGLDERHILTGLMY